MIYLMATSQLMAILICTPNILELHNYATEPKPMEGALDMRRYLVCEDSTTCKNHEWNARKMNWIPYRCRNRQQFSMHTKWSTHNEPDYTGWAMNAAEIEHYSDRALHTGIAFDVRSIFGSSARDIPSTTWWKTMTNTKTSITYCIHLQGNEFPNTRKCSVCLVCTSNIKIRMILGTDRNKKGEMKKK